MIENELKASYGTKISGDYVSFFSNLSAEYLLMFGGTPRPIEYQEVRI